MLSKITRAKNEKGFAWIELLVVITIIVILAGIAMPQFNQYKMIRHNSEAKANLNNLYLACKAYWADLDSASPCTLALATTTPYGYIQDSTIVSAITDGAETSFAANAYHNSGSATYSIDANGTISSNVKGTPLDSSS
ncbi:MAG: prepilin-type N-terminal cleavage/methylation domain-containing protein [Nitrospinaceae bacterium]|jgi:prepilin-type N-terminal cleavage/methylation domain-containing protein|nr:prepilin-type N-terminal cleavage/methylation domain-containing protein [Nitrospinaceae bacterium]